MIIDILQWFGIVMFALTLFFICFFVLICVYRGFKWLSGKVPLPKIDTSREIKTGRLIVSLFLTLLILSNIAIALAHIIIDKGRIDWRIIGITLILSTALLIVFIFIVAKGETFKKAKEGFEMGTDIIKKVITDKTNDVKTGILNANGSVIFSADAPVVQQSQTTILPPR